MATYYANTNSVGGDGTTTLLTGPTAAYKTLTQVNTRNLSPNDQMLFSCNCIFRGVLRLNTAGALGGSITYDAYGSGVLPAISGTVLVTGWTVYAGNIYQSSFPTDPEIVIFDGTIGTVRSSRDACVAQYDWYWDPSGVLYTWSEDDPDLAFASPGVEAGNQAYGWGITTDWNAGRNYITLRNLRVYGQVAGPSVFGLQTRGWLIDACQIGKNKYVGIQMPAAYDIEVKNSTLIGWREANTEYAAISMYGWAGQPGGNVSIHDNTINYWTGYAINVYGELYANWCDGVSVLRNNCDHCLTGVYTSEVRNVEVAYNHCHDNLRGPNPIYGYWEEYGWASSGIDDGEIHHNDFSYGRNAIEMWCWTGSEWPGYTPSHRVNIYCNIMAHNTEEGFRNYTGNIHSVRVSYNKMYDNGFSGFSISNANTGYDSTNCQLLNNVFAWNRAAGSNNWYGDGFFGSLCPGWTMRNNTFYNDNYRCLRFVYSNHQVTHDHNCYYRPTGEVVLVGSTTYALSQVPQYEATGVNQDPRFVAANKTNPDFHLQTTSPCKDAGTPVGLNSDFEGYPVPY